MDAFSPFPPDWAKAACHAYEFCCPRCEASAGQAKAVWINRRSPVYTEGHRRKWQEFYQCGECDTAWWAWSSDRPTPKYGQSPRNSDEPSE